MKIILISLLFSLPTRAQTIYKYGDRVSFKINPFYSTACNNYGEIVEYYTEYGITFYNIKVLCPKYKDLTKEFRVREDNVTSFSGK